jgi:hypothetical protein
VRPARAGDQLDRLLAEPDVAIVHVRTRRPQCSVYAVTR